MEAQYEEAVAYLESVPRFTKKHTLAHTKRFAERIDPDYQKQRVIHVAGTNGKGSVCNYLRALLQAEGQSVMFFSSPHLSDMTERFSRNGQPISHALFLEAFEAVRKEAALAEKEEGLYHPTYFEFLFLMQLYLCKNLHPDVLILETGLGGLLDATNVFEAPALTIITRIGLDHCSYLGDTKEEIAAQKAGIIKPGVPLVLQSTQEETDAVIRQKAGQAGAPVHPVSGSDCRLKMDKKGIDFSYQSLYYSIDLTLRGRALYQGINAATAIRAYEVLCGGSEKMLSPKAIQDALYACSWPCRMEEAAPRIVIDGAHNEDGIEAFLLSVAGDGCRGKRTLLFAVAGDKDTERILQRIAESGLFARCHVTKFSGGRAMDPLLLEERFKALGQDATGYESAALALRAARPDGPEDLLYIAGSLYLAGEIRDLLTAGDPFGENR